MTWICRVFGHKFLKVVDDTIYRSPDHRLCFRCGPLDRRKSS